MVLGLKQVAIFFSLLLISSSLISDEFLHVVTEDWKPYNFEEQGVIKGESTANVIKVLERAGIEYDLNLYPWSRVYRMGLKNKNTLVYTIIRMPARETLFVYLKLYYIAQFNKT